MTIRKRCLDTHAFSGDAQAPDRARDVAGRGRCLAVSGLAGEAGAFVVGGGYWAMRKRRFTLAIKVATFDYLYYVKFPNLYIIILVVGSCGSLDKPLSHSPPRTGILQVSWVRRPIFSFCPANLGRSTGVGVVVVP